MSLCDKCIHRDVCGEEDAREEAVKVCDDFIDKSILSVPNGEYIKKKDAITLFQRVGVGSFDFDNYTPEQAERFIINQLNNLPTYSFPKREKGDFEGMTNGEVLKSIFPTAELILGNSDYIPNVLSVKEEWWNAPYKAESEE